MTLLGYLLVLTGVVCCTAAPASDPERPQGSCGPPPRFQDKELQGDWNEEFYIPGKTAQYSCRPGYIRLGAIRYGCFDGGWAIVGTAGQCKKKSCGHPGDIEFGILELKKEESFVFGAVVEYTCNDGYQMISKHRTRECTATGWSNYRPECQGGSIGSFQAVDGRYTGGLRAIHSPCRGLSLLASTTLPEGRSISSVKFCPPVQVGNNVNLLTTSYEEEYSVGQVIRFECKNVNQKLNGASEIFCTSEGEWNAPPPICEEVKCSPPKIIHGGVSNAKPSYKDKETLEFYCEKGYKSSTTTVLECTKNDWRPTPICEDIVCYKETVRNGIVQYTKDTYRDGDTVTLTCNEGYQIEHKPEEPRTCTANGWNPPLNCISKKCSRPNPQNAYIDDLSSYHFPMTPGYYSWFYYNCHSGFLSDKKYHYGKTSCTKTGWNPEPKCYKKCDVPSSDSIKAHISQRDLSKIYIEGEKLRFQCYKDHKTANEQTRGEIECLPDGKFSGEKCSKSCQKPNLVNGEYITKEDVFDVGAYFIYKCKEGFISSDNKVEGISECGNDGWQPKPECKEIYCTQIQTEEREEIRVPFGIVIHFKCQENGTLEGSSSIQCFHYGWSSTFPTCRNEKNEKFSPSLDLTSPKESKCPPIPSPSNAQVINPKAEYFNGNEIEVKCDPGYQLYGSEKGLCKDGKWQSPPWCIGNPCGKPQEILNGRAEDDSREYKNRERAAYVCVEGYKLSQTEPASCSLGKWKDVPRCIYSSCKPPPKVTNGILKEVQKKDTYFSGERVTYECAKGYTMGQSANYITCEDNVWTEPPVCRAIGQTCGAPPVVQFGDITGIRQKDYQTGSSVKYKCANYYKLEGKPVIICKDGVWEKEPVCRVPCTVKETDMQQNNIQPKWGENKKIYSEHFDNMTFDCKPGYQISDPKLLRIQCLDGVLKYPRCLKEGSCVLQQTEMTLRNIRYSKSTEIENGQTIEFECEEGLVSDNGLEAICINKQIQYPRCYAGQSCPPPEISNAKLLSEKRNRYESGSSVNIKCEDTFVLSGHINVKCENGQWDELPQCLKPCTINPNSLERNHIELVSTRTVSPPELLEHDTELNVKCKANYKRPGSPIVSCYDGVMKYPKCFSGETCRILQQNLDDNFLELDERHENEVFYEEGATVSFKCKTGYRDKDGLTGVQNQKHNQLNMN
ncbi:coagulation factor XIII B chain-like isoform X3 [Aquarana catesbeiana]|uniref:coagulation factor XIII B chain-like isoform X3 n=1 Tax=Aquarana catesbeiana TaxID=8400 RepID=UPI003CCA35B3